MKLKELASGLVLHRHIERKCKEISVKVVKALLQNAKTFGNSGVPRGVIWGFQPPPHRNSDGPPKWCHTQRDCENC